MDIHVHFLWRHLEKEQHDGRTGGRNDVAVGLGDGVEQQAIADEPLVDEDVDRVAIELLQFGLGVKAGQAKRARGARGFVGIALPWRRFGKAGAIERRFGSDRQQAGASVSLPKIW